jgi:secretion/DNA translocation related TadE-like protein
VLAAVLVAVLLAVTVGGLYLGAVVIARHRAQAAADLAALAGAQSLPAGREQACRRAEAVAGAMSAAVAHCDVEELDVLVTVEVAMRTAGLAGGLGPARAAARAGPRGD